MEQLKTFTEVLFEPEDLVEIRVLPAKRGGKNIWQDWTIAEDLPDYYGLLKEKNATGLNIFVGVMPRTKRGAAEDHQCLPGRVAWADLDGISARKADKLRSQAGLPHPTLVVSSGHGTHLYWRMTHALPPDAASVIVYSIAMELGGDVSVRNPSRILRVPGFENTKEPGAWVPCEIVDYNPGVVVSLRKLHKILPNYTPPAHGEQSYSLPEGKGHRTRSHSETASRAKAYVDKITATSGERDNTAYKVAAVLLRDFDLPEVEAAGILREWNATNCRPPLEEGELGKVFHNASSYGKKEPGNKVEDSRGYEPEEGERRRKAKKKEEDPEPREESEGLYEKIESELREELEGSKRLIRLPWKGMRDTVPLLLPGKLGIITGLPGSSKSFLALQICKTAHLAKASWAYLPLEDTRTYHTRRMMAGVAEDWILAQHPDQLRGRERTRALKALRELRHVAEEYGTGIYPNPAIVGDEVKAVRSDWILDWAEERAEEGCRLIVIDPLAQIEFDGREEWRAQASFVRELIGIANRSNATILLVVHKAKTGRSGVYSLEGSKRLGDLAHSVLAVAWNRHEWEVEGRDDLVKPRRIITVEKCRGGSLDAEASFGFAFGENGPNFQILGKLKKKISRNS